MANSEHFQRLHDVDLDWNPWRMQSPDVRPDLKTADLSSMEVSGAMFHNTDLAQTNLSSMNFFNMTFEGSSLHAAHLHFADLRRANLRNVDLSNSNLILANLSEANLANADLTGALIGWTIFGGNDLSTVRGLDTVHHVGPSVVGIDTIYKSNGLISVPFLQGTGVPQVFIDFIPDLVAAEEPIQFCSCFISHSSRNATFCDRLYADLLAGNVRAWYFPRDAVWVNSVWEEIDKSIKLNDKVLLICSRDSLNSPPVMREVERCLAREDREGRNILFPISIDDYLFNEWEHARKPDIVQKVVGDFRGWQNVEQYGTALRTLLAALQVNQ
jgi:hypothetical protein